MRNVLYVNHLESIACQQDIKKTIILKIVMCTHHLQNIKIDIERQDKLESGKKDGLCVSADLQKVKILLICHY